MTIVEHDLLNFPAFVWATDLHVEVQGDRLAISGIRPVSDDDVKAAPDLFRAYREAIAQFGPHKRQGKNSPHIEFANADTNEKLISFVERFGPVVVSSLRTEERIVPSDDAFEFRTSRTFLIAHQDLAELSTEHEAYRAALMLVSQLKSPKGADVSLVQRCISQLADRVSEWPSQWQREKRFRTTSQDYADVPRWMFDGENVEDLRLWRSFADANSSNALVGPDAIDAGHLIICEILNAFSPFVYLWGKNPVEAPHWDLTGGIRPVLYYILRREYLQGGGIGICRNTECRQLFELERGGQEFCGDLCSRRQRQREYWIKLGRKLRKRRLRVSRATSFRGNESSHPEKEGRS
jgi:hypothetical protein